MQWPRIQPLTPERATQLARDPARRRLLDQMDDATTREEIDAARRAQHTWLVANQDDFGVLSAGEILAYAEGALTGGEAVGDEHPPGRCPKCTAPAGHVTHAQHLPTD